MSRRRGFTLIELLVVIAIIAILAAILFPVFARAREKARQASCLSNVKQIMTAVMMYIQDYDSRLPRFENYCAAPGVTYPAGDVHRRATWIWKIHPYVRNQGIFDCPSSDVRWDGSYTLRTSYGWNRALMHYSPLMYAFRMRDIANPAEHPAVADVAGPQSYYVRDGMWVVDDEPQGWVDDRHNGGANIGFMDGHAKWASFNLEQNLENRRNDIPGVSPWWRARP